MRTRYHFSAPFLLLAFGAAAGAEAQVDPQLARRYFQEATELCERDAGRLWGVSLCGPMLDRHAELRVGSAAGRAAGLLAIVREH